MITLGAVLPSLIAKLNLSGLQTTSLVTFLPLGMLAGSLIFGPIVDRFGHKALLVPSCIIVLLGMEGLAFFESVPLLQASIVGIGLGGGILNGETNALVSDISGESEKGSSDKDKARCHWCIGKPFPSGRSLQSGRRGLWQAPR